MCLFSILGIFMGSPSVLLAEVRSEYIKWFLGNTFIFPEIINDPLLIFSPYVFIFRILFWLLFVEGGCQQILLPLKPKVEEYYIFCKTEVVNGYPDLLNLGEIYSWLQSMFVYCIRYRGRKILNNSDTVSEAQQNLIIKYADSPEQQALIREYPEYIKAARRLDKQAKIYIYNPSKQIRSQYNKLTCEKLNTFGRLERVLRQKIRKEFNCKQANIDIKRQLSGAAIDNEEAKNVLRTNSMLPEQIDLLEKLQSGRDKTALLLLSHNTAVTLKAGRCVDDYEQQRQPLSLPKCRRKNYFWRRREIISGRPKNLEDAFNVTAILCYLFIVEHINMANTNQLYDTFEKSTWRIGDVICVARIFYMKCIFVGMQKMFIVLLPNAITTQKKNQDRTLIRTDWEIQYIQLRRHISLSGHECG
ncbi:hypothetical protein N7481_004901 [Penicillium waksmanii]|uniref:uncharacterized protein n=1 Tax=Penicillium waksmanii TaxID=69791 RepID=UPI002547C56E|nr:uncharacterized protein N7481_004901 [Penicillium waksmanii]KAJ5989691.1 hypothetical protein N7481_004901 [Penicillium waksmanii]